MKHKHADLIALYNKQEAEWIAAGCEEGKEPWRHGWWANFDDALDDDTWERSKYRPTFSPEIAYRYVPPKRTVRVYTNKGEPLDLPAPLREVPKGERVWYIDTLSHPVQASAPVASVIGAPYLYATQEDAEAWRDYDRANRAGVGA